MQKQEFFAYQWHIDDNEPEITAIRVYGLTADRKNVCLRIDNFTPYVYLELPTNYNWDHGYAQLIGNKIDEILGNKRPVQKALMHRAKLYGAYLNKDFTRKEFPYLFCSFSSRGDIKTLGYKLKQPLNVPGLGAIRLKIHESDADPILQLVCCRNIPTAGWIKFSGKLVEKGSQLTLCDYEYCCGYKTLYPLESDVLPACKVMGFDIEVNSTNPNTMPNADRPGDKVFQISCVTGYLDQPIEQYKECIITLGDPDQESTGKNVKIVRCETEADVLTGFTEMVRQENPNMLIGYNIMGFDFPYMVARAKSNLCIFTFDQLGFHKYAHSKEREIKWSSSAYKNQRFSFLDAEGRLVVDLLPLIKRDFTKMNTYTLKNITTQFLGETKDPLSAKGIFKCYRLGTKKSDDGTYSKVARKAISICARYCVQDARLVIMLVLKLGTWPALTEMAKVCNTPIFNLYTAGQQIKVYSQIYKHCFNNGIVVEKDAYIVRDDERYVGAHVFPPIPGAYNSVVPFDFCVTGDTKVTMKNGTSKRITRIAADDPVMARNLEENGMVYFPVKNGLQEWGKKETVKIYMFDSRVIQCTPDHKLLTTNGFKRSGELVPGGDELVMGLDYPEDIVGEDEEGWTLELEEFTFTMDTDEDREKSLAFARMLGYILSDRSVYVNRPGTNQERFCCEACFGTELDARLFEDDMVLIDKATCIRHRDRTGTVKGSSYTITLSAKLSRCVASVPGVVIGKRALQKPTLPEFILDENCPLSIIREFLAGLFGGDGTAPYMTKNRRFGAISFKWTIVETFNREMAELFVSLGKLLEKFGIRVTHHGMIKIKYGSASIKPVDSDENPRYDHKLGIVLEDTDKFLDMIGFRYCLYKSCRLTVAGSYMRLCRKVREQHDYVVSKCQDKIDINHLRNVHQQLLMNEPVFNDHYSLPTKSMIKYRQKMGTDKQIRLLKSNFPNVFEYIKMLGVESWFKAPGAKSKVYAVNTESVSIPTFHMGIVDVRPGGIQEVYDIEVEKSHTFVANGIVSANCALYPSIMIAYNIDYHTWVKNDSDIPDSMCNVYSWQDCQGCPHDPKVVRMNDISKLMEKEQKKLKDLRDKRNKTKDKEEKAKLAQQVKDLMLELKPYTKERSDIKKTLPKHSMCAKRYYRTLKEPLGVLPTVVKGFLDARAAVRGKQKVLAKQIDELKKKNDGDYSKEIKELNILYDILEKRQLAYKVSANSAYGAMGVRKGYLPFMIGAMIVTYMGRVNINKVAKTIPEKFGGHLVYGDSVTGDTPILCKINGKIAYRTIDNLPHSGYTNYRDTKENAAPTESLEVWTETGFTPVKNIIRHKTTKRLFRVLTHTGVVDVTEDHGLLDTKSNKISVLELGIGDRLLTKKLPEYEHFTPISIEAARQMGCLSCVFYNKEIPEEILYSSHDIRQAFFEGFSGYNSGILLRTKLTSAKAYYLASSLGYKVTIQNDPDFAPDWYYLTCTKSGENPDENVIVKITELGTTTEYVYDLETENHHFSAGVGQLIVHNTDSNYVNFPHLKTAKEIWDHAVMVAKKVSEMFPPPMKIEFENVIYSFFMILTKKRYMYRSCGEDGIINKKIGKKGVLLARRDNSKFVRDVYEAVIGMIADGCTKDEVLYYVLTELNLLCSHSKPLSDFVITKAVGDIGDFTPTPFMNEKGQLKAKIGDYTVPILDADPDIRSEQMKKKGADTEEDFYLLCLPAQVQLAERMRRRGQRVDPGTRLEYVVSLPGRHTAKQYEKVESAEYMVKYGYILGIDYLYYIHALATPLDQVLTVIYHEEFVMKQYKFRSTIRKKVIDELNELFSAKFIMKK